MPDTVMLLDPSVALDFYAKLGRPGLDSLAERGVILDTPEFRAGIGDPSGTGKIRRWIDYLQATGQVERVFDDKAITDADREVSFLKTDASGQSVGRV